jgi:hypothetical protein
MHWLRADPEVLDLITPLRFLLLKSKDPAKYNKVSQTKRGIYLEIIYIDFF